MSHPMQVVYARASAGFAVTIAPHCPPQLAALLQRCLAVEPAERPECSELRAQLLALETESEAWSWGGAA